MEKSFVVDFLLPVLKGILFSLFLSLVSVLVFALVIKLTTFSSVGVKAVNQFIKVISVFLGVFLFVKEEKGLIKGGIIGVLYAIFINLIFSLIGGNAVDISILDLIFMLVIGIISGVISINVHSKN